MIITKEQVKAYMETQPNHGKNYQAKDMRVDINI